MRLLFAGSPAPAAVALRALLDSRHEVVAVLSRPDARAGRGRQPVSSAVTLAAREAGLEVLTPRRPGDEDFVNRLLELRVDAAPVVAYGALLPEQVLNIPRFGWINLHFSVLPAWRGAAPVQHAILSGDEITGATTFRIDAGMDTGATFGTVTQTIRPGDTSGLLLERLAVEGAELLVRTLDGIEDGILSPVAQAGDQATYAPKITTEDALIRWGHPAYAVDRRIRACTPQPGAWTTLGGARLVVGPVQVVETRAGGTTGLVGGSGSSTTDGEIRLTPGELLVRRQEVLVGTATSAVRLGTVTPAGRKTMSATDWARGARLVPGTVLGGDAA